MTHVTLRRSIAAASLFLLLRLANGAANATDYLRLRKAVFDPYVSVMPRCNNGPLIVNISLAVYMIVDVDELDETFQLSGWYIMTWTDCALVWNSLQYANITESVFPDISKLWLPDVTWFQRIPMVSAFEFEDGVFTGARASVSNKGAITVNRQILMNSYCPLTLLLFPFDTQYCNLTFTSWNYDTSSLIILNTQQYGDMLSYRETGMWKLQLIPLQSSNKTYASGSYTELTFTIVMQREPLFYIFYLMLPGFLMSFLGSFVYLLPSEAQQKNAFSLSILVSLTVFMNIMVNHTPPKSEIPLLSIYFFVVLVMSTISSACGVLIEAIYETNTSKPVPHYLREVFLLGLARWSFFRAVKVSSDDFNVNHNHRVFTDYLPTDFGKTLYGDSSQNSQPEHSSHPSLSSTSPGNTHETPHDASSQDNILNISFIYGSDGQHPLHNNGSSVTESGHSNYHTVEPSDWWKIGYAIDRLLFIIHLTLGILVVIGFFTWGLVSYYVISPAEFDVYASN